MLKYVGVCLSLFVFGSTILTALRASLSSTHPPDSAVTGYAVEGALFIPVHLSIASSVESVNSLSTETVEGMYDDLSCVCVGTNIFAFEHRPEIVRMQHMCSTHNSMHLLTNPWKPAVSGQMSVANTQLGLCCSPQADAQLYLILSNPVSGSRSALLITACIYLHAPWKPALSGETSITNTQ